MIDYFNKYIKYKNKYYTIKKQFGAGNEEYRAKACTIDKGYDQIIECNIHFNNNLDTCWTISIFMIFIFSDSTSKCVQNKLFSVSCSDIVNDKLSNCLLKFLLPIEFYAKQDKIILLLNLLIKRFNIKVNDQHLNNTYSSQHHNRQHIYTRQRSESEQLEDEFSKIFFNLLNKYDNIKKQYYHGGPYEIFFLTNILSCLLLQKLIKLNNFVVNQKIEIELLTETIGILIFLHKHFCSFYICNNKMKFCNNNLIIDYNWVNLFKKCNELYLKCKKYKIFLNIEEKDGPFIYVDDTLIYFVGDDIYNKDNSTKIVFDNNPSYLNLVSFIFLNNTTMQNFKKNNIQYYISYYRFLDNECKYIDFIKKNHYELYINNTDYNNESSLLSACEFDNVKFVKLLLQYPNIDINKADNNRTTPLQLACINNNIEIIKLLLQYNEYTIVSLIL